MATNVVAKELINLKKSVEKLILHNGLLANAIVDHSERLEAIEEKLGIKPEEEIPDAEDENDA